MKHLLKKVSAVTLFCENEIRKVECVIYFPHSVESPLCSGCPLPHGIVLGEGFIELGDGLFVNWRVGGRRFQNGFLQFLNNYAREGGGGYRALRAVETP